MFIRLFIFCSEAKEKHNIALLNNPRKNQIYSPFRKFIVFIFLIKIFSKLDITSEFNEVAKGDSGEAQAEG